MFHTFRDDARRRITVTLSGPVAFAAVISFLNTQRSKDAWDYGVLYDARGMIADLPPGDLQLVAGHVGELSDMQGRGPVAVVWATESQRVFVERYAALVQPAGVQVPYDESRRCPTATPRGAVTRSTPQSDAR